MKISFAVLLTLASIGSAVAQTTTAPPPPTGPTAAQCRDGHKADMPWTKDAFTKACADLAAQKKP